MRKSHSESTITYGRTRQGEKRGGGIGRGREENRCLKAFLILNEKHFIENMISK